MWVEIPNPPLVSRVFSHARGPGKGPYTHLSPFSRQHRRPGVPERQVLWRKCPPLLCPSVSSLLVNLTSVSSLSGCSWGLSACRDVWAQRWGKTQGRNPQQRLPQLCLSPLGLNLTSMSWKLSQQILTHIVLRQPKKHPTTSETSQKDKSTTTQTDQGLRGSELPSCALEGIRKDFALFFSLQFCFFYQRNRIVLSLLRPDGWYLA